MGVEGDGQSLLGQVAKPPPCHLVDSSEGMKEADVKLWGTIQGAGRRLMIVLTKVDRCHPEDLHRNVTEVIASLQHLDKELIWPYIHAVSAEYDLGLKELR